ncbi:hypothetical protein [Treponema phagedenis]|uniref:hypothetical protein n=2 Tax=Treponemataceae TaxID=2845253 RepID=UPI0015A0E68B|nr:hypothetical protein [Treponema phagedenis]QLC59092.1 hypothetical protein HW453_10005 [Treponema phagedenis]
MCCFLNQNKKTARAPQGFLFRFKSGSGASGYFPNGGINMDLTKIIDDLVRKKSKSKLQKLIAKCGGYIFSIDFIAKDDSTTTRYINILTNDFDESLKITKTYCGYPFEQDEKQCSVYLRLISDISPNGHYSGSIVFLQEQTKEAVKKSNELTIPYTVRSIKEKIKTLPEYDLWDFKNRIEEELM